MIVDAHMEKEGYTAISKYFKVSRVMVHCFIAKYKETHSVKNKPRHGKKQKVSNTVIQMSIRTPESPPI